MKFLLLILSMFCLNLVIATPIDPPTEQQEVYQSFYDDVHLEAEEPATYFVYYRDNADIRPGWQQESPIFYILNNKKAYSACDVSSGYLPDIIPISRE